MTFHWIRNLKIVTAHSFHAIFIVLFMPIGKAIMRPLWTYNKILYVRLNYLKDFHFSFLPTNILYR